MQFSSRLALSIAGLIAVFCGPSPAQTGDLSLSPAVANPGATVVVPLALTTAASLPAGLQWTISYSPAQISAVAFTPGPVASAAGKTLSCASGPAAVTCILIGLNTSPITSGTVAYLSAALAPTASAATVPVLNQLGADPAGNRLALTSASAGVISVPSLSLIVCSPAALAPGDVASCSAYITLPAPAGGSVVAITSNNALLSVPASVTIPPGASSTAFTARAATFIIGSQTATVTAVFGGSTQTASLTLAPLPQISSLGCAPPSLGPGAAGTCTIVLSQPPAANFTVSLSSSSSLLTVPSSVTVPAHSLTAAFPMTAAGVIASNQTALVTASAASGSQSAAIALTAPPSLPASVTAMAGTLQSATVNTSFASPLQALVNDAAGNPVSGVAVNFSAPGAGPGATFSGLSTATAATNAAGVATSPALAANGQAGSYTITASVTGIGTPARFSLTNIAASVTGGVLTGTGDSSSSSMNLTAEGTLDWAHWASSGLVRKAGVNPLLSGVAVVGSIQPLLYNNDPRSLIWTDGTPVSAGADNSGVYVSVGSTPSGFSFTAPADSTSRTLTMHVGGWYSAGTLTAHLSDGSSPDFTDTTNFVGGQYDRNYQITYSAGSAGQALTITWLVASGPGNVTLNAAALSLGAPTISAFAGAFQTTAVNTLFATSLQAAVQDTHGHPLSGAAVTFTAPAQPATAFFAGSSTAFAITDINGIATAPPLTASGQAGAYTVTAAAPGTIASASFPLANSVPSSAAGGTLVPGPLLTATAASLTAEGTLDWVHWGEDTPTRKAGVSPLISNYTVAGSGPVMLYSNDPRSLSWTDGAPVTASTNNNGVYINFPQNGFSFTVPADLTKRKLTVHVGGWFSAGTFTAHLSDQSAPDFTDTTTSVDGQYDRNYTLFYSTASPAQTLTISWLTASGAGNVTLNGAALALAANP